jgi:hypothetical protein
MISNMSGRGSTPPLQVASGQDVAASAVEAYLSPLGFEDRIALEATGIMAEKYSAGDILHMIAVTPMCPSALILLSMSALHIFQT